MAAIESNRRVFASERDIETMRHPESDAAHAVRSTRGSAMHREDSNQSKWKTAVRRRLSASLAFMLVLAVLDAARNRRD